MKSISILLAFCGLMGVVRAWDEPVDELGIHIQNDLGSGSSDRDLSWITDETRPIVIARLMEKYENPETSQTDRGYIENKLLRINHVETIERLIARMHETNKRNSLEWDATEEALAYLIPQLDIASTTVKEPVTQNGEGFWFVSNRSLFLGTCLDVISRRKVFPEQTRRWAADFRQRISPQEEQSQVNLLKAWWDHNRKAIMEKRYAEATWLPAAATAPAASKGRDTRYDPPPRELRRPILASSPPDRPASVPAPAGRGWVIGLSLAALGTLAAAVWKWRAQSGRWP